MLHHRNSRDCGLVETVAKRSVTEPERTLGTAQGVRISRHELLWDALTHSVLLTMQVPHSCGKLLHILEGQA